MAEFTHHFPGTPCNHNRNNQCRKDHDDAQWFPDHAPCNILEQPENDMHVFHFPVLEWNMVLGFLGAHDFLVCDKNTEWGNTICFTTMAKHKV